MNQHDAAHLFEKIKNGNEKAFEILFHNYYGFLCTYATKLIHNDNAAEEIIQDFFVKLWEKKSQINIETSVNNYLFRSVKNLCLNHIQHNKIINQHAAHVLTKEKNTTTYDANYIEIDLAKNIEESIHSLPEKRQQIFRLSREEGLKYREIAEKLNISIKTVETQMSLAIRHLREKLKNYNTFLSLFMYFNKNKN